MFGAGQTKQRNSTNTKKTKKRKTKKPKQSEGKEPTFCQPSLLELAQVLEEVCTKSERFLQRSSGEGQRDAPAGRRRAGRGGGGGGTGGGPGPCPEPSPASPSSPPTLTFRILRRQQARLHGALPSARRSPAPGARMARRRLREERISAGLRAGAAPTPSPIPRPVEPPLTWGKVNGTCWSTYPFILPPGRYLRGRGAAGSRSAPGGDTVEGYQRAGNSCRGRGLQAGHPAPDRGLDERGLQGSSEPLLQLQQASGTELPDPKNEPPLVQGRVPDPLAPRLTRWRLPAHAEPRAAPPARPFRPLSARGRPPIGASPPSRAQLPAPLFH